MVLSRGRIKLSTERAAARAERAEGRWRLASQPYAAAAAVLAIGIAATALAAYLQYAATISESREQFAAWSEERRQRLSSRLDAHIEALHAVRSFFDSSEFVSQQAFARFTSDALERHRYLRSIDFLRRVALPDRSRFERICRELFDSAFVIFDYEDGQAVAAPSRAEYTPIVYTQPEQNDWQVGMDLAVEPLSTAMMRAADDRKSSSAGIIVARGERGEAIRWMHIYLPVYAHPSADGGLFAVVMSPAGYVRVRFPLDDMLADIYEEARKAGIDVRVLESSASSASHPPALPPATIDWRSRLAWSADIAVADRKLRFEATATRTYAQRPTLAAALPLALTGLSITLLGAVGAYQLARSRQRIAQSEVRHRVLVDNSPDAILLYQRGRTIFVNRAALKLFGAHAPEQLLDKTVFDLLHPDFHEAARGRIARMLDQRAILPPLEAQLTRLDGALVDVEIVSAPYLNDGEVTLQVTVRDITERRRGEMERAELEAALRQSQRLEAIGTLTGGIAHDFNNILSAIVGNVQLLLQEVPEVHPARRSVQEIRSATQRARELVKRLMTFGTQQEAPRTAVALEPLIAEVQRMLRPTLPAGIALRYAVPEDAPPVIADATQLHQVLVNLCTNAWQSMRSGLGVIEINVRVMSAEEARRQSQSDLHGAPRYVCIEVDDDGSGIPPEILSRIFEPFFTTKRAGEGSGLGLAMVHGIVQSHKGAISVRSRAGEGTSFRVFLPASEAAAVDVKTAIDCPVRGAGQRVLYIDDEEPLVFLVTRMLERCGYRCTGETDARQAIAVVREDPAGFDLVITDLNMPAMSGIDVASELQQLRPDLPVVITTGCIRAEDAALARDLAACDLILKPDTIEELPRIVSRYLPQAEAAESESRRQ
jgi:PAS domain S-box-containing protein